MFAAAPVAAGCRSASTIAMLNDGSNELLRVGQAYDDAAVVTIPAVVDLCKEDHCGFQGLNDEALMRPPSSGSALLNVMREGKCGDAWTYAKALRQRIV